ncbi:carbohydrate porin [Aeoliella mucimassa]|uniref:Porin B n=1 Tax=Aeoliella mucimassa TaxID=2527972 RepID=A0A518AP69_9BACT|nr:carbohydrate porin [Aeoliella mucimassa]QDU56512.1 Porin B precursor [Aeoliella mucimassa]
MAEGLITFKFGKQDGNADFCALDSAASFIGSSFGLIPNVPLPTFPDPAMGAAVYLTPNDAWWIGAAVFDGCSNGRTWGWSDLGCEGSLSIVEAIYRPAFASGSLPGGYHVGLWYHSGEVSNIGTGEPHAGNYGLFTAGEQLLWKEHDSPEDDQGLALFGQFGWAPEEYNDVTQYYGGGLLYKGLFKGRDNDYVGFGIAHACFSTALTSPLIISRQTVYRGRTHTFLSPMGSEDSDMSETALEWFYLYEATPWLQLQPDLQYIVTPGGSGRDALVVGLRFQCML